MRWLCIGKKTIESINNEASVVATLVFHPEFSFHSEHLTPHHFCNEQNSYMYYAICQLAKQNIMQIDTFNIVNTLARKPATSDKVSIEQVREFIELADSIAQDSLSGYNACVKEVLDAAFRRETYTKLEECQRCCYDLDAEELQKKIYGTLDSVLQQHSILDDYPDYKDVIDSLWEEIKSRQGDGYAGIPFKFPSLNDFVTIERGELIIFGAQQKVGKSIMLLNCAVSLLRQGYSVLYIDSELSSRLFTTRLLSHLSGVEYKRVASGVYGTEEEAKINQMIEWMKTKDFTHIYMPFFDPQSIYTAVKRTNYKHPLDVVIIDYFKSMGNEVDAYQTYAAMGRCVDLVKNEIAGAMNIAAIGAAQATINNRLADSAKIARNASTIIMLMDKTPDEIEADGEECGNKKLVVTVNRNGMQHKDGEYIDLFFDGNHVLYREAKQHIPQSPF